MKLDREVPGCFGPKDHVFAGNAEDAGRAFGWLNSLRKREISWEAASAQIADYLKSLPAVEGPKPPPKPPARAARQSSAPPPRF